MYKNHLKKIIEDANKLLKQMDNITELPAWVQDKLTIAQHNLEASCDYVCVEGGLESDTNISEKKEFIKEELKKHKITESNKNKVIKTIKEAYRNFIEEGKKESKPLDKALYSRVKSEAKKKFKVFPSAYASAWIVRTYKKRGGRYA